MKLPTNYTDAKAACGEALLLFRERPDGPWWAFAIDAWHIQRATGAKKIDGKVMICDLEGCLETLIAAGHRVAICEQVQQVPARAEIERIVTPGSIIQGPERKQLSLF